MKTSFKKVACAAAVAMAVGIPMAANAAVGTRFNPTGGGLAGAVPIDQISWQAGNALFDNTFQAPLTGTLYGQTLMAGASFNGTPITLGGFRFSYQFGLPVTSTVNSATQIGFSDAPGTSFFSIFVDETPVAGELNAIAGTGYGNENGGALTAGQKRILTGTVTLTDLDDPAATPGLTLNQTGNQNVVLGLSNGRDVATKPLTGSTTLFIDVSSQDANYFPDPLVGGIIIEMTLASLGLTAPFDQNTVVNDSVVNVTPFFGDPNTNGVPNQNPASPTLIPLNDFLCASTVDPSVDDTSPCDAQLQSSGNTFFRTTVVPEPGSLALLGLGLAGLGAGLRRRR